MFPSILKLAQPFVQRYLTNRAAEYSADYLNRRRERCLHPPPAAAESTDEVAACPQAGYSGGDVFWFTLSGMVLGSALGVILSRLTQPEA
jgi:hypothetical protein